MYESTSLVWLVVSLRPISLSLGPSPLPPAPFAPLGLFPSILLILTPSSGY